MKGPFEAADDVEPAVLEPGSIAAIAEGIESPAFVVSSGGQIVFQNAAARALYPRYPRWLAACGPDADACPAWVRRVALPLDNQTLWLLLPDGRSMTVEDAGRLPWAVRIGLPHRLARVAVCVVRGMTDVQIALELGLSHQTVRTYMKHVFARAGVHSRAELVRLVLDTGGAPPDREPRTS